MNNSLSLYLRAIRGSVLLITVGALFAASQAGGLPIQRTWPLILIVAGLMILAERLTAVPQSAPLGGQAQAPYGAAPYTPPFTPTPQATPYVRPARAGRVFGRRRSIAGPLVVILIGVLFLLQTLSPVFSIARLAAHYWPYLLIAWGLVQILEVSAYAMRGRLNANYCGVGGGGWLFVVLICLIGSGMFAFQRPNHWWYHSGFRRGVAVFGAEHDYTLPTMERAVGSAPHVVIEGFRGDAKITGSSGTTLTLNGRKAIRAMDTKTADRANGSTPVEVQVDGNNVTVRCPENGGQDAIPVTTDLQLSIPSGASVQFDGLGGDLSLSSIAGDVRLGGHGGDVHLEKVGGGVTVDGHYEGMISLQDIAQHVHVDNMGTHLDLQRVPGEVRIDRGMLSAQNVIGPMKVDTDSTDVTLQNFTQGLELSVGRGDVSVQPTQMPLSSMNIHTRSGNIDLHLPQSARFTIAANTRRGDIENDFGEALAEQASGQGARLEGAIGAGPDITLTTDQGTITVRRSDQKPTSNKNKASKGTENEPVAAGTDVVL